MAHILTKGIPNGPADFLVDSAAMASNSALNAELGNVEPGTVAHTAGYAVQKEKGLNGSWTQIEAGSSLPPVTAEDNGDVLTVVDGAWGKAAPSGISGTDEWKGRFQNIAFIYYEAVSDTASDIAVVLPQATILGSAEGQYDSEIDNFTVEFGDWMTEDFEPIPDELAPYAAAVLPAIRHDFIVAHKIKGSDVLTWCLPDLTITTAYYSE